MDLSIQRILWMAFLVFPVACGEGSVTGETGSPGTDTGAGGPGSDADGDGFSEPEDCDDGDPDVHPGATDICNGEDDDCDGDVDEDPDLWWYTDADGDGFGDLDTAEGPSCEAPDEDRVPSGADCDDDDPEVFPGRSESCNGVDDDCDGEVDEGGIATYVDAGAEEGGDGSPDAPFTSVQEAISAADACVSVAPGTYEENIDFGGNSVAVYASGAPEETVLQGTGSASVVKFRNGETSDAVLSGFTVTGGEASSGGGGIYVYYASPRLENLVVTGNSAASGGGIYVYGGDVEIHEVTLSENEATSYGGGLCLLGSDSSGSGLTVESNLSGYMGGGIYVSNGSFTLSDGVISGNRASSYGGGALADYSSGLHLERVEVSGNEASVGGGLVGFSYADITATGLWLLSNSGAPGGAIWIYNGSYLYLTNAVFDANLATGSYGADLHVESSSKATVVNITAVDTDSYAACYVGSNSYLYVENSILAYSPAFGLYNGDTSSSISVAYSDVYGHEYGASGGSGEVDLDEENGNLFEEPGFVSFTQDLDPSDDDLTLSDGSPCIDAGNPDSAYDDTDGSPNDMGAFGGPEGDWAD